MKIKKMIIFIFVLLFFPKIVSATSYTCAYDFEYKTGLFGWLKKDTTVVFTVDQVNNKITYPDGFFDEPVYFMDYYVDSEYTEEYIIENLNGGCPQSVIIGCIAGSSSNKSCDAYAVFFEESNFYELEVTKVMWEKFYTLPQSFITGKKVLGNIPEKAYDASKFNPDKSTGEQVKSGFGCTYYSKSYSTLKSLKCESDSSNCDSSEKEEYNKTKSELMSFCESVLSKGNVSINHCVNKCIDLKTDISKIEKIENDKTECGLPKKLLTWILNIVKWVKYIVPVIVILLGMLDFIRAVLADKDDGMKKAQGRFVRRLIAAALIFIVPLILTFILEKMGFTAEMCNIKF